MHKNKLPESSIIQPKELITQLAVDENLRQQIQAQRQEISNIIHGKDRRVLAIVGPCSIHDPEAALEYARRLKQLAEQISDTVLLVMRVYFEKPRTTVGWKGLINDPHLDNSFEINEGLTIARRLLIDINKIGLPAATELLDLNTDLYIGDLISWAAIGARTTESQLHRLLASKLNLPVGFKNSTSGEVKPAVDAILAAASPQSFLGVDEDGQLNLISSLGNPDCHVILRGGNITGTNYDLATIEKVWQLQKKVGINSRLIIDCSHGNSEKNYKLQGQVLKNITDNFLDQSEIVAGFMLESNLLEGSQELIAKEHLIFGKSITDSCIGWDETASLLTILADSLRAKKNLFSKQDKNSRQLSILRAQIDKIDNHILQLINTRAKLALDTMACKNNLANTAVYDPRREQEILDRLSSHSTNNLSDLAVRNIFQNIINECRNVQLANLDSKKKITIAVQGDLASFSEQAALDFCHKNTLQNYQLNYAINSNKVIELVKAKTVDLGLMAFYNSTGGLVEETIQALLADKMQILTFFSLHIRQNLLVLNDQKKSDIQHIFSHQQALRQCRNYLKNNFPHVKLHESLDTALSAKQLAAGELPQHSAVIGNAACAKIYNLKIMEAEIQDLQDNHTWFVMVKL